MILLDTTPTHLRARNTPFHTKDVLKALPGARWDRDVRAWVYPKSASVAKALASLFPDAERDIGVSNLLTRAAEEQSAVTLKSSTDLPDVPSAKLPPWAHQKQGFWFAARRLGLDVEERPKGGGAMLAMDMGTGKTKVVYDLMNSFSSALRTTLVTCPKSVCPTWEDENEKHGSGAIALLNLKEGSVKKKTKLAENFLKATAGQQRMIVINHESMWREPFRSLVKSEVWDLMVTDECHRAKSPGGKFSRFLGNNVPQFSCRLGLTGTPMPRDPMDLYAQARFLEPGIYGTNYTRFKRRYGVWGGYQNRKLIGIANEEDLYSKLDSFCFRVKASEVLDLPPASHMKRFCKLSSEESKAYKQMEDDLIADVGDGVVTAANALVRLLKLQQIVQGSITDDYGKHQRIGDSKQQLLREILEDLSPSEPLVIFARFKDDLARIRDTCEDLNRSVCELSGRVDDLQLFKGGGVDTIAVQIQAGGVGIDLSRAAYTIYYSPTFDMGAYEQSLARTHRPGQTRPTFYYHLLARGTIDTKIHQALTAKKKVVESVLAHIVGGDDDTETIRSASIEDRQEGSGTREPQGRTGGGRVGTDEENAGGGGHTVQDSKGDYPF
jgi:SNF2 family DNA or RNA helicase